MTRYTRACSVMLLGLLASGPTAADSPPAFGTIEGRVVEGSTLEGVGGATIIVTESTRSPLVAAAYTTESGGFSLRLPPGSYEVMAIHGMARFLRSGVLVKAKEATKLAAVITVEADGATTRERAEPGRPPTPPMAEDATATRILPYSEEAILQDVWAVCWMLLDISDQGAVTSLRFAHRAGQGLDEIAEKEAFRLRFRPARDGAGRAVASQLLWKFEWPSYHYMKGVKPSGATGAGALVRPLDADGQPDRTRASTAVVDPDELPRTAAGFDGAAPLISGIVLLRSNIAEDFWQGGKVSRPPCRGSGPLNLDGHEPFYRDCSPPDLRALATEKPIRAPAGAEGEAETHASP